MGRGLLLQTFAARGGRLPFMAVALAADAIQLSARSKGYPSFIALCKGAGLDTEMHVPHAALSPDGNQDAPATEAETVEESATAVSILKQW